jgi:aldehyde dehydrogenase (NAD+)
MPAPQRGEIVRQFGEKLRENKEALENWFLTKWGNHYKKDMEKFRK